MNQISNNRFEVKSINMICDQHINNLHPEEKEILEHLDWTSLLATSLVNKSLHQRLIKLINYKHPSLERFIDLRQACHIQTCIAPQFRTPCYTAEAIKMVKKFYETRPRPIKESQYGVSFPMNPELMYYAMFLAKNEIVLEIAGARGEHAALLGFSGAKRVYMNDLVPQEIADFKTLSKELPEAIQKKIEPIQGSCFDLLDLKPELCKSVGLVICNNLIHFFNDDSQQRFLNLLMTLLKPGGRAILTVNACYLKPQNRDAYDTYPDHTAWQNAHCFVQDYTKGTTPVSELFHAAYLSSPDRVGTDYQQYHLWLKDNSTRFQLVENQTGYQALPKEVATKLKGIVEKNLNILQRLQAGSFRLLTSTYRVYREESLAALFKHAGFIVEQTCLIDPGGHLYFGEDPYDHVAKIGIVIRAPDPS